MADGMSFDKYIDNPMGGAVLTNRSVIKQMYRAKFDAILVREQGRIKYYVYRSEDEYDSYYIHMKIPSEVVPNFYYDVVVQLYTLDNAKKNNANLRSYAAKFYSNDPAFVYTFAHAFERNNLFIKDLEPKMIKAALKDKAEVKNPTDQVGYVKSLFFAYITMEKYNLFSRPMLNQHAVKYVKRTLLGNVEAADKKVKDRQSKEDALNAEKRKEKEAAKKALQKQAADAAKFVGSSNMVKSTKKTKATKSVVHSRITKSSKITGKK